MDPEKVIVCRCEDVLLSDVLRAIEKGYRDLESIKRLLRVGMGSCQGRHCLSIIARVLAKAASLRIDELNYPPSRPPLMPIQLKYFVSDEDEE
ncbi:MAG: (2Fe-2S)-binding protein [Desulfurococcaceae archaeon]